MRAGTARVTKRGSTRMVMRSSSDWVQTDGGTWVRAQVQQTHGPNRDHNSTLEEIFKGAATTIVTQLTSDPLYEHYVP